MEGWQIATWVLAALGLFAGVKWTLAKRLLKEVAEALVVTSSAIEDDEITPGEEKQIVGEWRDVILAALKLFGR